MYTTNWVFLQYETNPDRGSLETLHSKEYPAIKSSLSHYLSFNSCSSDKDSLQKLFSDYEQLQKNESEIMSSLATFEDYQQASNKFMSEDMLESEVLPKAKALIDGIERLIARNKNRAEVMNHEMSSSLNSMLTVILLVSIGVFLMLFILTVYIHRSITTPVIDVQKNLSDLSLGKIPEHDLADKDDVIGTMVNALRNLNESFNKTSSFAIDIGHGNFDASFTPLSEHDRLGQALLNMRQSLKAYSEEMEQKVADRTAEILKQKEQIESEKKKSEELLLNILPHEVAEELKANGRANARRADFVSVLFTDMVNFTRVAESLSPEQLVALIDFYFRKFDEIIGKYHIEKIKTIGDAYMCAAGIPTPNPNGTEELVLAALEMQEFVLTSLEERTKQGLPVFNIRFGIHCGPVVAGIVGMKKFAYDIWGDTVNTAARMEQKSEAGKINVSEPVFQLVQDKFMCTYRGEIEAKNKGMLKMYYIEGRKNA